LFLINELCIRVHLYVYDLYIRSMIIDNHHTFTSPPFFAPKNLCFYLFPSFLSHAHTFIIKIQNYYQQLGLKNGVQWKRKPSTNTQHLHRHTFIIIFCLNYFINCILHVLLYRNIRKNVHSSLILLFEIIKYRSTTFINTTHQHTHIHRSNK
jgi:hypothetical protein